MVLGWVLWLGTMNILSFWTMVRKMFLHQLLFKSFLTNPLLESLLEIILPWTGGVNKSSSGPSLLWSFNLDTFSRISL